MNPEEQLILSLGLSKTKDKLVVENQPRIFSRELCAGSPHRFLSGGDCSSHLTILLMCTNDTDPSLLEFFLCRFSSEDCKNTHRPFNFFFKVRVSSGRDVEGKVRVGDRTRLGQDQVPTRQTESSPDSLKDPLRLLGPLALHIGRVRVHPCVGWYGTRVK